MSEKHDAPLQLELFAAEHASPLRVLARSLEDLRHELNHLLRGRLAELVLTENRERILSARRLAPGSRQIVLRLDASFLAAPVVTLTAVAAWVTGSSVVRRAALVEIRAHFDASRPNPQVVDATRQVALRPQGKIHDLAALYVGLNSRYFDQRVEANITWGSPAPRRRRRGRRTIQLGLYRYDQRLIRIHPALDHPSVPEFVVESVVFHEMLHAWLPAPSHGPGRRCLHNADFRQAERRFDRHEAAQEWIAAHLNELLARA